MFSLRPATHEDFTAIRSLIHKVNINPTGLDWRRFMVATSLDGKIIGCGQIKLHRDGDHQIYELASIAVQPEWRGQGVARALIERLLGDHPGTLYLTCRARLGSFYKRFGFRPIVKDAMPTFYRRLSRFVEIFTQRNPADEKMLVMKMG
jgi:N-acetylglutamate synthase-like GNAT family acetyltransferase